MRRRWVFVCVVWGTFGMSLESGGVPISPMGGSEALEANPISPALAPHAQKEVALSALGHGSRQWNVRFAHIPLSEYTAPCIRLEFQSDTGFKQTFFVSLAYTAY